MLSRILFHTQALCPASQRNRWLFGGGGGNPSSYVLLKVPRSSSAQNSKAPSEEPGFGD